ncbi:MAG: NAD(P)/FAD-dependent oxidoreductase [Bacteroidota bacterium]
MKDHIHSNISSHSGSNKYDVVIIGAGIGGLTAAAVLAKSHLKVCIVEMAPHPGGYLCGFERNGFHFETSIHWLNQCGPDGFVRRIFNMIAPGSPHTPENTRVRRFVSDSYDYLLTNDPDQMRDEMISQHKSEEKAIRKFFDASKSTASAFTRMINFGRTGKTMSALNRLVRFSRASYAAMPLIRYLPYSAQAGTRKLFRSSGLKNLYCTEKRMLSCLVPVGWAYNNDYQLPPKGGGRAFTEWLYHILRIWEAPVFLNSRVQKILMKNGQASGVKYNKNGKDFDIQAKYVIASCDINSLYTEMLPKGSVSDKIIRKQQNAELYNSCVTVSIGLDCEPAELGLKEEQVLIRRDDISPEEQQGGAPDKTEISVLATSSRDPSAAPEGKGVITIYTSCDIQYGDYWKTERDSNGNFVRGDAYRSFKKEYADILIRRVEEKLVPGLQNHIEVLDIATPLTYLRYTGNRDGAIMGFQPNFKNIRGGVAKITTPIKNLYIGGQWAELGGGVPNAVKAGVNSALMVIKNEKPEAFSILADVVDGKISPEETYSSLFRTL